MPRFEVSVDDLLKLSNEYHIAALNLRNEVNRLRARSEPLRQGWVGSSAAAFQDLSYGITASQEELVDRLMRMAQALADAAAAYASVDDNISKSFEV